MIKISGKKYNFYQYTFIIYLHLQHKYISFIYLSIYSSIYLSIYSSIFLFLYLSIPLSFYSSTYLFKYLSINLSMVNNPTLSEFCFRMIGRADIRGSKSYVAMNAWQPQASYPCGNFSVTSFFKP